MNREQNDKIVRLLADQLNLMVEDYEEANTTAHYGLSDGTYILVVQVSASTHFSHVDEGDDDNSYLMAILFMRR